jgi:alkylation response protein AidB-like acyl-CoA dehydrogenase
MEHVMAVAITEDHLALSGVLRDFVKNGELRAASRGALDGTPADVDPIWDKVAQQGWLGLHVPEEDGGSGFGLEELAVVADELGCGLSPGPFVAAVVAAGVLARSGSDQLRADYLPSLIGGSAIAGVGLGSGLARDDSGAVNGQMTAVLAGCWASLFLLRVEDDVVVLPSDAGGLQIEAVDGLDPSLGIVRVVLDGARADTGAVLVGAAATATRLLRAVVSAEAAGGARATLEMAVEYAKVREQFGRTIGSFQAVKHHLANMAVRAELATALAWDAARADDDGEQGQLAAAAATVLAPSAYQENAQKNIQIHGGIGFTWEHDAHLYLRRAVALRHIVESLGSAANTVHDLASRDVRRSYAVDLPPEAENYRRQARDFLASYRAAAPDQKRQLLVESGYLVPHWPPPFGRGAGAVEQLVIEEELGEVEIPVLGIGGWVLLTLTQTASPEQIDRWIGPSLAGDLTWCQLFSEPNAGSDAASVQTRAVRVDGGWRVNGQKVWTSGAQHSNRGLATIRTDPSAPKHKGITAMVIDMNAEGVTVRPLREITGESMFNEVFFDDVFVPDEDVVGEVNNGWLVARTTLGNERVTIGGGSREGLSAHDLLPLASRHAAGDQKVHHDLADALVEEQAMRLINLRQVTRAVAGAGPGPEGNITKLLSAEHAQRVTELAMDIVGTAAVDGTEQAVVFEYLFDRCLTIAGGTSEIGRNVIAERILGLPRDPLSR